MRLNKNNKDTQSAIRKAVKSGAALGGLLAALTGGTGCGVEQDVMVLDITDASSNAASEFEDDDAMGGVIAEEDDINGAETPETEEFALGGAIAPIEEPAAKNAANEAKTKRPVVMGKLPARMVGSRTPRAIAGVPWHEEERLPAHLYRVKPGDTLTKIARDKATTVAELKRINGFDDERANRIITGEVIKVAEPKSNAANATADEGITGDI